MDRIFEYREYITTEILNKSDFLFENITELDDYVNEVFSSEYFDYNAILESTRDHFEEEIYREYRKIRPQLVKGNQTKKLTEHYFELERNQLRKKLEADRWYVKRTVNRLIEELQKINEKDYEISANIQRNRKIDMLRSYQRKTIRKINSELKEMEKFLSSNPKILVI